MYITTNNHKYVEDAPKNHQRQPVISSIQMHPVIPRWLQLLPPRHFAAPFPSFMAPLGRFMAENGCGPSKPKMG